MQYAGVKLSSSTGILGPLVLDKSKVDEARGQVRRGLSSRTSPSNRSLTPSWLCLTRPRPRL